MKFKIIRSISVFPFLLYSGYYQASGCCLQMQYCSNCKEGDCLPLYFYVGDSGPVNHPEIVTIPQTIVNVRATASATSSSTMGSMDGSSDSEHNPAKPFVTLKDRFLKVILCMCSTLLLTFFAVHQKLE